MRAKTLVRLISIGIVLMTCAVGQVLAQGTMHRPTAESETMDSSGHLKTGDSGNHGLVRGVIVLAGGAAPQELVSVFADCGAEQIGVAYADSKGSFSFALTTLAQVTKSKECLVRAHLEGYRSETKALTDLHAKTDTKLGKLVLQPLASTANGLSPVADAEVPKAAKKHFDKALDQAATGEAPAAIAVLQKATAAYPDYSSAWLALGILQSIRNDHIGALKSFKEAIRADPKFALPLIQAAILEAAGQDWPSVLDHSQKAVDLNPGAFPNAYALNAMANVSLQNIDAAEKSAREGLRLDVDHNYPELEYSLGIVLYSKGNVTEAAKHLQTYLNQVPNGPNAEAARNELAQTRTASTPGHPVPTPPEQRNASIASPSGSDSPSPVQPLPDPSSGPAAVSLQERNAPLLIGTPSHTCLETISRMQIDTRGRTHDADLTRVDIAVADGHEVYGYIGGKRFSNERLTAMLGYTFTTTGIYSSLARALIAGNGVRITFAGDEVLNGESVFRFNFKGLPSQAFWTIQQGKQSGDSGEEGSFLVDRASLTLRRVIVRATDIPTNLKLKRLDAVIDYELETIAARRILLPKMAQVHAIEAGGTERLGRMFFNHCRAFVVESTMVFNTDDTKGQGSEPPRKPDLPPDLDIILSLGSPIDIAAAAANDVVTATVAESVRSKGQELIARGASVEGHVRPSRGENAIIIEFDRVQTRNGWVPFYARMVSPSPTSPGASSVSVISSSADHAKLSDPEVPGVAKIDLASGNSILAAGTQMTWKTELLAASPESRPPQLNTPMGLQ